MMSHAYIQIHTLCTYIKYMSMNIYMYTTYNANFIDDIPGYPVFS